MINAGLITYKCVICIILILIIIMTLYTIIMTNFVKRLGELELKFEQLRRKVESKERNDTNG